MKIKHRNKNVEREREKKTHAVTNTGREHRLP